MLASACSRVKHPIQFELPSCFTIVAFKVSGYFASITPAYDFDSHLL